MKKTDVQLNKGSYRLHAQVVRVTPNKEKDKDTVFYYVIGGADCVVKGKHVEYDI